MTTLWMPLRAVLALTLLAGLLVACGGDDDDDDGAVAPVVQATEPEDAMEGHDMPDDADVDPDLLFIDAMIVHHSSAIEMAELAADLAERDEIHGLADDIIAAQAAEIEQMRAWRDAWFPDAPESDLTGMLDMPGMDMGAGDLQMLRDADSFDVMFIEMMIPHHESAIAMARDLQATTERPELQELAEEIISAQESEIQQMQEWLDEWNTGS